MKENENAFSSIVCRFESGGIVIFVRFSQSLKAWLHIFETFGGIKISLIFVLINAYLSIACKFEFGGISTLIRLSQLANAYDEMILIFDGIEISSMSRRANKRMSN